MEPKGGISIKYNFQGKYFNCDKVGQRLADSKMPKKGEEIK